MMGMVHIFERRRLGESRCADTHAAADHWIFVVLVVVSPFRVLLRFLLSIGAAPRRGELRIIHTTSSYSAFSQIFEQLWEPSLDLFAAL